MNTLLNPEQYLVEADYVPEFGGGTYPRLMCKLCLDNARREGLTPTEAWNRSEILSYETTDRSESVGLDELIAAAEGHVLHGDQR